MPPQPHADVLRELRDEWRRVGRSQEARRCVERLHADPAVLLPAGVFDLDGIVSALEPGGGLDQLQRAKLVAELLARASDPLIRRCLLQTLLPGIVSVARQLQFGAGIADDTRSFLADTLTEAVELLISWAGQRRGYAAPDLLNALRCRVRRHMLSDKRRRMELVGDDVRLDRPVHDESDDLVRELHVAFEEGVTDVDFLYARGVLGYSTSELAAAARVTSGVLHRRLVAAARPYVAPS
jgi:hypothetical protein